MLGAIQDHQLLTSPEYEKLLQHSLDGPLLGYRPGLSAPTLACLSELLHENWLGERLLDAVLDLFSKELNRSVPNLIKLLDCAFHMELSNSFHAGRPSTELIKLREEFLANPPIIVAFLLNKGQVHWSPAATVMDIRTVLQGDSSGFPPQEELCRMIQWWLRDVVPEDGEWEERGLPVEQQGTQSGSCGLASVSAIAHLARAMEETIAGKGSNLSFASWTDGDSSTVRLNWMQVLLRTHLTSQPVSIFLPLGGCCLQGFTIRCPCLLGTVTRMRTTFISSFLVFPHFQHCQKHHLHLPLLLPL